MNLDGFFLFRYIFYFFRILIIKYIWELRQQTERNNIREKKKLVLKVVIALYYILSIILKINTNF